MRVLHIAQSELRLLRRNGAAAGGICLVAALLLVSLVLAVTRAAEIREERERLTGLAQEQWAVQPDRHPHRVVHFGDFVFRPISGLAAFDLGAEAYAGHALFLEGHRQNPSNFSQADAAGAVLRFAQLTPAFVLHTLTPLLLLFVGAGMVAGERESGRLTLLASTGVGLRALVLGKSLALFGLSLLLQIPAALWWLAAAGGAEDGTRRALTLCAGYTLYLLIWSSAVVLVSTWARSRRGALLTLLGVWALMVVLLPRLGATVAPLQQPAPTRVAAEIQAEREQKEIGDSHNPDDPHFAELREKVLAEYGVSRVEDLPVNYGGLVMLEGERLTTELYNLRFGEIFSALRAQSSWNAHLAWITPFVALRSLSGRAAGVDLEHLLHFLAEGEIRRYAMVQALNGLHAEKIRFENDRGQRLSASHWEELPRHEIRAPTLGDLPGGGAGDMAALCGWALLVLGALLFSGRTP